jgi:hypothetical protein
MRISLDLRLGAAIMGGEVRSKRDKLPAEAPFRKFLRVVFEKGRKLSP